ncbi:unnamed protein product [Mytilus edulis]|uniref:Reverse transcriptase domain-containing protein n=1 Tax=Mytilus edulis TaxID=6550 RepID=A0A8S3PYL3_MYTED|nr:unnamed protein product [Mytilus edulis]
MGNGYWKMNDSLLDKELYTEYINNFWINWKQRKSNYNILDWWEIGKKKIKELTIRFSKQLVARERIELSETYMKLENEENKIQPDQIIIDNLSETIIKLENKEKMGTIIRSRQDYYEEDIDNIDFFKQAEEKRGDKREVESVLDKNGKSCTSKSEVIKIVTDFYSDLYKSQNIDRQSMTNYLEDLNLNKLTEEDKTNFDTFITQDECLKLLKEFKNNKSPGVDGIGKSFYLKFWNIIGEDMVEVLNNVYLNGELTETMKTGLISLIYKNKGNRKDMKQWRPISLLCVDYKILTKFLSKNLSKILNKLLDKNQTGAGPEKLISDNLLSIESILEYMDLNGISGILISFDQEKAFDRVEHEFIIQVLRAMNFPSNFIRWIEIIYTNISSKVIINGALSDKIEITRSIRQGCPISMSIYAVIIEALACKVRRNNNIQGIQIPNHNTNVKLFQHADDCSIISTNLTDYEKLLEEFKQFGLVSGSKINENKTEILKIGNPNTKNYGSINKLIKDEIKVLGIWFGKNAVEINWKKKYYGLIQQIDKWKKRKFRYKHKVLVLNTYIISKFLYTARIYPPSEFYIKKINKVIYDFFWDNIELLNRTTITKQYKDGGQQVPDIKLKCEALLLYRITQVLTGNSSVWTSIFIYFIGITTRTILPKLAENMYRHSVVTIGQYERLKCIYLKYQSISITDYRLMVNEEVDIIFHCVECVHIPQDMEVEGIGDSIQGFANFVFYVCLTEQVRKRIFSTIRCKKSDTAQTVFSETGPSHSRIGTVQTENCNNSIRPQ